MPERIGAGMLPGRPAAPVTALVSTALVSTALVSTALVGTVLVSTVLIRPGAVGLGSRAGR
ncbi:hypothetical protein O7626_26455 [Micromonospora sp. WMMD1102]|uniref:hypothetical protein n=1 Tax=Micromonospora sp. WMMD1102 TaxID=3016105 RepID=UPI00241549E0|nr:hypothetical protein [Micromonospora sp. WMMD1102]MDG4789424.1 hypothetical protein [Micromonospora sp. WMMD1102]